MSLTLLDTLPLWELCEAALRRMVPFPLDLWREVERLKRESALAHPRAFLRRVGAEVARHAPGYRLSFSEDPLRFTVEAPTGFAFSLGWTPSAKALRLKARGFGGQLRLLEGVGVFLEGEPSLLLLSHVDAHLKPILHRVGEESLTLHLARRGLDLFPPGPLRLENRYWVPLARHVFAVYEAGTGRVWLERFADGADLAHRFAERFQEGEGAYPVEPLELLAAVRLWGEGVLRLSDLKEGIYAAKALSRRLFAAYARASSLLPPGYRRSFVLPNGFRLHLKRNKARLLGTEKWLRLEAGTPPEDDPAIAMRVFWDEVALSLWTPWLDVYEALPEPLGLKFGRVYFTPDWALLVEGPSGPEVEHGEAGGQDEGGVVEGGEPQEALGGG